MSRSLLVSRASLSLSDLQLWAPGKYFTETDSFGPGSQVLRREVATGPYTTGRILIGYTFDTQTVPLAVRVEGVDAADLAANLTELLAAFHQPTYTLTMNFDGLAAAWVCEPADYTIGAAGVIDEYDLKFHAQPVVLNIPRSPVPSSGAF